MLGIQVRHVPLDLTTGNHNKYNMPICVPSNPTILSSQLSKSFICEYAILGSMLPDLKAYEAAIDGNTCMLYACAPQYPHGVMDPIQVRYVII